MQSDWVRERERERERESERERERKRGNPGVRPGRSCRMPWRWGAAPSRSSASWNKTLQAIQRCCVLALHVCVHVYSRLGQCDCGTGLCSKLENIAEPTYKDTAIVLSLQNVGSFQNNLNYKLFQTWCFNTTQGTYGCWWPLAMISEVKWCSWYMCSGVY